MRWTGLAIRDALTLSKEEIQAAGSYYRVVTSRQKTGTHVSVPLQSEIAIELLATPNDNPDFLFWDGKRDAYLFTVCMGQKVRRAFEAAGLDDGQHMKSHRLRDTFAVELLQRGVQWRKSVSCWVIPASRPRKSTMQNGSRAGRTG
jgi:integrase